MRFRRRRRARGATAVEVAAVVSVVACAACIVGVSCWRSVRVARTAEAVQTLERIARSAAQARNEGQRVFGSAPMTPAAVPRGAPVVDAPGTWDHATWRAIEFSIEEPHWYAYRIEADPVPGADVRAMAHGDLDGDGVSSTFERRLEWRAGRLDARPGLIVTGDLE